MLIPSPFRRPLILRRSIMASSLLMLCALGLPGCDRQAQSAGAADATPEGAPTTPPRETDSAGRIALYLANGDELVVLSLVSVQGRHPALEQAIAAAGGRVDQNHPEVGYLDAVVPTGKALAILADPAVEAGVVDNLSGEYGWPRGSMTPDDPVGGAPVAQPLSTASAPPPSDSPLARADELAESAEPVVRQGEPLRLPERPFLSQYNFLRDLDAERFRKLDPKFDGRGVVIAQVEWFPDFLSPDMQLALDAQGKPLPKFADVINTAAPALSLDPNADPRGDMWSSRLGAPLQAADGQIAANGRRFRVPAPGEYRLATWEVSPPGGPSSWTTYIYPMLKKAYAKPGDVEEDKDGAEASEPKPLVYDLLWSDATRTAWLDLDGDGDFSNERGVREYRLHPDVGVMGRDDPATALRESVGYTVQYERDRLSLNVGFGGHATLVAGAAAANRHTGGRVDGIAPAAQILPITSGAMMSFANYARGLVAAYVHPATDVVLVEGNGMITSPYHPRDGSSMLGVLISRLVEQYRKPTFITADNVMYMTSISDFTVPANVMSVGAAQSAGSLYAYYGLKAKHPMHLHWVGAEGPAGNGALKPDLLSPANPITISARHRPEESARYGGVFDMPVGYMIGGGTSTATPVAAGAAALLVGAAKLRGLPHDADAIHEAMRRSARHIPAFPVYKQGNGVLRVAEAWQWLQQGRGETCCGIRVSAPVRTVWSKTLAEPDHGPGLFEREGWSVGQSESRTIRLQRTAGPQGDLEVALRWEGDRDSFKAPSTLKLPLGQEVTFDVTVSVQREGVHSALARLVDTHGREVGSIPMTVVVPHDLSEQTGYAWSDKIKVERPGRANRFVRVPEGAQALIVRGGTPRENVVFFVHSPLDQADESRNIWVRGGLSSDVLVLRDPVPGVWEISMIDRGDAHKFDWSVADADVLPETEVSLDVTVYGNEVKAEKDAVALRNLGAATYAAARAVPLGGLRQQSFELQGGQSHVVDVEVEPGQQYLGAEIAPIGPAAHDVQLYALYCKDDRCKSSRRSELFGSEERVLVEQPQPGRWKLVAVAVGDPARTTRLQLKDYYAHPKLGALYPAETYDTRDPGSERRVAVRNWRLDKPREGYEAKAWLPVYGLPVAAVEYETSEWDSRYQGVGTLKKAPQLLGFYPLQ